MKSFSHGTILARKALHNLHETLNGLQGTLNDLDVHETLNGLRGTMNDLHGTNAKRNALEG